VDLERHDGVGPQHAAGDARAGAAVGAVQPGIADAQRAGRRSGGRAPGFPTPGGVGAQRGGDGEAAYAAQAADRGEGEPEMADDGARVRGAAAGVDEGVDRGRQRVGRLRVDGDAAPGGNRCADSRDAQSSRPHRGGGLLPVGDDRGGSGGGDVRAGVGADAGSAGAGSEAGGAAVARRCRSYGRSA
jgi:hypothetical protein